MLHPLRLIHYITMFRKSQEFFAKNMKKTKKIFLTVFLEPFRGFFMSYFRQKAKYHLTYSGNQSILEVYITLYKAGAVLAFCFTAQWNCDFWRIV